MIALKGEKVRLRAVEPSDLDLLYLWENNQDNWQLSNTTTPFSRHTLMRFLEVAQNDIFENKQLRLMIVSNEDNTTVGSVDLFDYDPLHQRAGIGILINESKDRRQGFASESIKLMLEYCEHHLMLNQLFCHINVNNKESIKLFENNQFKHTGTLKKWLRTSAEQWDDVLVYQYLF
jgi:diamine N-acetyltransferase